MKNGRRNGRQRYKCRQCGKQLQNSARPQKKIKQLWKQYIHSRQTIKQLADQYHKSKDWIWRQLDHSTVSEFQLSPQPVVAVADVTFFGRGYGVLVFRSQELKQNLYWTEVTTETIAVYQAARQTLEDLGFTFKAVVLDGRKGVRTVFSDIPIQMCHFHQIQIVTRYLSRRPKLEAGIQLRLIALGLTKAGMTEPIFTQLLQEWHTRWKEFLKERTIHPDGKHWQYTHRKIRSAYQSLQNNLPYLFTYQKYPELKVPNTTNSLDGSFSHLKDHLRIHRGLTRKRRWRVIQEILAR